MSKVIGISLLFVVSQFGVIVTMFLLLLGESSIVVGGFKTHLNPENKTQNL